jgi:hypothetical protein
MTKRASSKNSLSPARRRKTYRASRSGIKSLVLESFEELLDLYCDSNPRLGQQSEKGKYLTALHALRVAGNLTHWLTDWAEDHIAGVIYRQAHAPNKHSIDWNSHANECEIYQRDDGLSLTAEQHREYIAIVLEHSSPNRRDWRWGLSESLFALNDGEVQFFTRPSKTNKHGRPYTLRQLRWYAVLHVHVLVGTGMKKYAAESKIAEELGQSVETLRSWEKQQLKHNSAFKRAIFLAQKVPKYHSADFENPTPLPPRQSGNDQESLQEPGGTFELWYELTKHPLRTLARELRNAKVRP